MEIVKSTSDKEQEMAKYVFDGLSELLLGNLLAHYQSEGAYLDTIFPATVDGKEDYVQKEYFKVVLENQLWRLSISDKDEEMER